MQTTTLRVRVSSPSGLPAPGASVRASLRAVGVSLADGYVDRSDVSAITGSDGVAELVLWPSSEGTTGIEYRIVARGAEGRRLLDERVTVPASEVPVWLHDIVMTPTPTPKPYDEAAIEAIQQNRILAQDARDNVEAMVQSAESVRHDASDRATQAELARDQAVTASDAAQAARNATDIAADTASQAASQAGSDRQAADEAAASAATSAESAALTAGDIVALYGSATALRDAEAAATQAATAALSDRQRAEEGADEAQAAASSAATEAQAASGHEARAETFADKAVLETASAIVVADMVQVARVSAETAAGEADAFRLAAEAAAQQVSGEAALTLDRAADLISHADSLRSDINGLRQQAQQSVTEALALYGDAQALSDAVIAAQGHQGGAEAAQVAAEQAVTAAQQHASQAGVSRAQAQTAAQQAQGHAEDAGDDRQAVAAHRQQVGTLHASVTSLANQVSTDTLAAASHRDDVEQLAQQARDDVAITYVNRAIINTALANNLIILRG